MKYKFILLILILFSCEGENKINGIIIDSETGNRIPEVKLTIETYNGNSEELVTDSFGYFESTKFTGCNYLTDENCIELTAEFEKLGYESLVLDESFFYSPETEMVPETNTLIIKMNPN